MRTFFSMSVLSFFFPQKSGDADNRPPSMAIMFDGVQFFSFSLDIVRPECSVSIDAVLKATVIGALPVVVSIVMMLVSSLMAFRKARVLRQAILASVPNLMQEMSIRWILYHALLDAFVIQKPVFHRELKYASTNLTRVSIFARLKLHVCFSVFTKFCPRLWVALSPFRRVKEILKLRHFNPIVAAAKTKYSKKIIQFKRSHDTSWLIIENDCQGEFCVLRARFQCH